MEQIFVTVFIIFLILSLIGLCMYVYVKFDNSSNQIIPTQPSTNNNLQQNMLTNQQSFPSANLSNITLIPQQNTNASISQLSLRTGLPLPESQNILQSPTLNSTNFKISVQRPSL